jgi:hypothetical protein
MARVAKIETARLAEIEIWVLIQDDGKNKIATRL